MPSSAAITLRPIYMEDLAVTRLPAGDTATETVLDQGPTSLTKIPLTLLTSLAFAANDAAAAALGVPVGKAYYDSALQTIAVRMT